MSSNQLLIDEYPLLVYPSLAVKVGLNEAIVLQQIHYWVKKNAQSRHNYRDGHYWVYNTYEEWQKQFPWWSDRTLRRIFKSLEKSGYLIAGNYNKMQTDRTKWYSIDYERLGVNSPSGQIDRMEPDNMDASIPETNTETNNGSNGNNGIIPKRDDTGHSVSVSKVYHSDKEISDFIKWYFEYYEQVFGEPHPNIKSDQRVRVHDTLKAFCCENDLDAESLQIMADAFFGVENSDHNINHFATDGILANRFYETLY